MTAILKAVRRTPYQSSAAFLVLFLTLFLSILILFSLSFLNGLLAYVETRPQVTVYFKPDTEESNIFNLRDDLSASGKVSSVKYISKQDAYNIYKESNKDNPLLLEMVSSDILPPSLEVYATKPTFLPEIAEFVKKNPGVDDVNFQKVIIDKLLTLTSIIRKTALIFFVYLVIMTIIILITITHFKVALKKDEIELLRLLGASGFYIKKPFLQEALFFGVVSAAVSFLLFVGILLYLNPFISSYIRGINTLEVATIGSQQLTVWPLSAPFLAVLFSITTFFGIIISSIATLLATQKYIK